MDRTPWSSREAEWEPHSNVQGVVGRRHHQDRDDDV